MRSGFGTTEFWLGAFAAICVAIQQQLFPEHPFPEDAFMGLGLYMAARIGEKTLGNGSANDKRAWRTSEFWTAIASGVIGFIAPDMSPFIENLMYTYILGRPAVKITKDTGIINLLTSKKE